MPNGLNSLGYHSSDIPKLVDATLPQHRVTKLSPISSNVELPLIRSKISNASSLYILMLKFL